MSAHAPPLRVVVVGGGLSGSLCALHLLLAARPVEVTCLDRVAGFARGLAYGTACPAHLLNVPAGRMSALPERPGDLCAWAATQGLPAGEGAFLPRMRYGDYLAARLSEAQAAAAPGTQLRRTSAEAVHVQAAQGSGAPLRVDLADGRVLGADHVVLATGNLAPSDPLAAAGVGGAGGAAGGAALDGARYARDPWHASALEGLGAHDEVLLLGTGLTAVDLLLALRAQGVPARVHALSRHGWLPQAQHAAGGASRPLEARDLPLHMATPRHLLRALRRAACAHAAAGGDWRDVIGALRPHTPALWQALGLRGQAQFLRHLRTLWDVHRHRLPGGVEGLLAAERARGGLVLHAGRVRSVAPCAQGVRVHVAPRGGGPPAVLEVARIINATGPSPDLRRTHDPLLASLARAGALEPHPLGLGLCCDAQGAVAGTLRGRLWALGSLRMGLLWESTAAPELRVQARDLALQLAAQPG